MKTFLCAVLLAAGSAPGLLAADSLAQVFDGQVKILDGDVVALAEAMPADKYNFAPANGSFKGVRTYAMQVKHIATMIYMLSAAIGGQKPPVDIGPTDNGPDALKSKAEIVGYLKGSLAFAHKAVASLTEKNQLDPVTPGFGGSMPRIAAASMITWHTFDHYGQMVVYARMNGVIPGANQGAAPAGK